MNIVVEKRTFKTIPYLLYRMEGSQKEKQLVIISHGYNCDKYEEAPMALQLALEGFHVLTYDLAEHGERSGVSTDSPEVNVALGQTMMRVIDRSYTDLEQLIERFSNDSRVDRNRIILVGVSLGAMLTYYALTKNKDVHAAVTMLGTPDFIGAIMYGMEKESLADFVSLQERELLSYASTLNPLNHLLKYERRPMLIMNNRYDEDIPYEPAQLFYERQKEKYLRAGGDIDFLLSEDFHVVNQEMIAYCSNWLRRFW
ncbi:putative hydrolase of the alpha/beta superfamily [Alkalibacterium sp. AK22]|uniref:alpha/beta hydrolase family protein n=1 Tax=Alkalibacterium sp. AK22 TaxID=1229520 RepID=UPI0004490690|nr:alpha/beta fold hydrolase [Alkalibacterium sp. AK22]EXJ22976.1 putative hydrolase of the alpha/beta superfamily [Alkalibacterium sp. AK22]